MTELELADHIPTHFKDDARTFIYQSNRLFTFAEVFEIEKILQEFIDSWQSHGQKVDGYANLFYGRFIVIMSNEDLVKVSGCSIDSSVAVIKKIEQLYGVNLFDRQLLAFLMPSGKVEYIPFSQASHAFSAQLINDETLFFNNVVLNKADFLKNWIVPLKDSWLHSRLKTL